MSLARFLRREPVKPKRHKPLILTANWIEGNPFKNRFAIEILLLAGAAALLSGCAVLPLNRFQPIIAPPNTSCQISAASLFVGENPHQFQYVLPRAAAAERMVNSPGALPVVTDFETYHTTIQNTVESKLPPGLKQHKVTKALVDFLTSVSAEAQLKAQVADGTLTDQNKISAELKAIQKNAPPDKLTYGEMKDFADKLFDLQLRISPATVIGQPPASQSGSSAGQTQLLNTHPALDSTFVAYFKAYYGGKFVDRMGTTIDKPQISQTIPDSEIAAAETVLLEFLVDAMDPTPVMGDEPSVTANTTFYPGASKNEPTAYSSGLANYLQISKDPAACGITTTNAWVLKDLANAASDQATAVGGLVANTPGGISIGLGVVGKISIGDNQTLSVLVKTAASRLALRATLASSYWTLRRVHFNVSEP
jgi:hypothetical protein